MKRNATAIVCVVILLTLFACTKNASNNPQLPPLTPEQKVAIAKIGLQTAAAGLAIAADKARAEGKADKAKYLAVALGIVNEANVQLADVTVIDLTNRAHVQEIINRALASTDKLTNADLLSLNNPTLQAEIRAIVALARSALMSFAVLLPV